MKVKQGDLVLVPFPFTDLTSVKTRPALVISNSELSGDDCILMAVSSQDSKSNQLVLENKDLDEGSLPVRSYLKIGKIVSLKRSIIRRVVGKVSLVKRKQASKSLMELLRINV